MYENQEMMNRNRTYLTTCAAYQERVGPNPNLAYMGKMLGKKTSFALAILIPLVTLAMSVSLIKMQAPRYMILGSAFFGMAVAVTFLYVCAISLSEIQASCELAESDKMMNTLTICFVVSLFVVITQSIFLMYL